MNLKQISAAFLAVGVAGCSSFGGGPSTPPAAGGVPAVPVAAVRTTPVVFTQPTAKVAIAPVTVKLPERRGLGSYTRNVDCWVYVRPIRDSDFPPGGSLTVEMRKALVDSKVDVVDGDKDDVAAAHGVDYLITGNIPLAHADLCINDFFNAAPADVDAQVTVAWQVWSVRENRVVFQTTTTGTGSAKSPQQVITPAVQVAMGDATEQLLQSAVMQQYLTFGHPNLPQVATPIPVGQAIAPVGPGAPPAGIPLPGLVTAPGGAPAPAAIAASAQPILITLPAAGASSDLKAGTVMIGKSAGFYVGDEGYLITSAAAVGSAAAVTVTDAAGKSVPAQVVRRADTAGLALIKVTAAPASALPILPRRLSAGDKVMTLGASGSVSAAAGSDGKVPAKLTGASAGAPVVDSTGNIVGVAESNGSYLPIAAAFRALTLGVTLTER
ncbi:MAG: Trypsin-like peptidase domain [Rhodospirillales bacterium]|nr:Trypsin-like peptidase domain [Rhodospirillales bacterium]